MQLYFKDKCPKVSCGPTNLLLDHSHGTCSMCKYLETRNKLWAQNQNQNVVPWSETNIHCVQAPFES